MTKINLPDGDSAIFSGEEDKDDSNIARNAQAGPERLKAFANAKNPPDYEQIEIWRNEEPVKVDVEILEWYRGTEGPEDPSEATLGKAKAISDGIDIQLTEDEQERVITQFLARKRFKRD